jgi:hypothetical protein
MSYPSNLACHVALFPDAAGFAVAEPEHPRWTIELRKQFVEQLNNSMQKLR